MIRAIGKGSLASILAMGLYAVRVVVWIGFAGLSAAIVVMPVLPLLAGRVGGIEIDGEIDAADFVDVIRNFISFGVALYVVERLLELLRTLRLGSPFVKENAVRFQHVGIALVIGEASKIALWIVGMIVDVEIEPDLDMMTLIAIAAVFVLSEVFREGARLKEEQDLTV